MLLKGCFASSIGMSFKTISSFFSSNVFFCRYRYNHIKLIHKVYFEIDLIVQKREKDILKNLHGRRIFAHARVVSLKVVNKFA